MNAATETMQPIAQAAPTTVPSNSPLSFFTPQGFELVGRIGKAFAASSLVPDIYRDNLPNCMIAVNMAKRIGADPMMVMQNLHVIHGRPGWSSQFLIGTFNTCGRFSAMRFEFFGTPGHDDYGCRAYATELSTGERLVGADVTIGIAKAEDWYSRKGSKWKTIPQQMLMYRAAAWFVRAYAPELALGLQTVEEISDVIDVTSSSTVERVADPRGDSVEDLNARIAAAANAAIDTSPGNAEESSANGDAVATLPVSPQEPQQGDLGIEQPADERRAAIDAEARVIEAKKAEAAVQTKPLRMTDAMARIAAATTIEDLDAVLLECEAAGFNEKALAQVKRASSARLDQIDSREGL